MVILSEVRRRDAQIYCGSAFVKAGDDNNEIFR